VNVSQIKIDKIGQVWQSFLSYHPHAINFVKPYLCQCRTILTLSRFEYISHKGFQNNNFRFYFVNSITLILIVCHDLNEVGLGVDVILYNMDTISCLLFMLNGIDLYCNS
jgi:hypothetical protein